MLSPSKRLKTATGTFDAQDDFVSLNSSSQHSSFPGRAFSNRPEQPSDVSRGYRLSHAPVHARNERYDDRRNAQDRPKSKHALPGYEPWLLVKTKLRRRFVYNTETKESLWRIPRDVMPGVLEFEQWESEQKEKAENAKWAEEQLQKMRPQSESSHAKGIAEPESRNRRRRSESLQREDEEALMAELAVQAEPDTEPNPSSSTAIANPLPPQPQSAVYDSDSSYEEVEVTDSEGEEDTGHERTFRDDGHAADNSQADEAPVEFGEDDIAYQLAAMGEDYDLDPGEYGEDQGDWEEGDAGLPLSELDATNLFRDLLEDHRVSPYTPWDKIVADESEASIINDHRYTALSTMRARKDAFDAWAKDKAAQIQQDRAIAEKQDPRIFYLALLHERATPKLYWPEFKRKYKREPALNDRKLSEKEREKLYRDHINRLKLPESTRKADLQNLLQSVPLKVLNRDTRLEALPQQISAHLHYISLGSTARDAMMEAHVNKLPAAPESDDMTDDQRIEEQKKRVERRRRENALAERERKVDDERRRTEKDQARARRDLRDEQREIQAAMSEANRGLATHLRET